LHLLATGNLQLATHSTRLPPRGLSARLNWDRAELVFITLDELRQRKGKSLDGGIAQDDPVARLEEHLGLAGLGVGVEHVEAEIDDDFFAGGVDAIAIGERDAHFALVDHQLHLLLTRIADNFLCHLKLL